MRRGGNSNKSESHYCHNDNGYELWFRSSLVFDSAVIFMTMTHMHQNDLCVKPKQHTLVSNTACATAWVNLPEHSSKIILGNPVPNPELFDTRGSLTFSA